MRLAQKPAPNGNEKTISSSSATARLKRISHLGPILGGELGLAWSAQRIFHNQSRRTLIRWHKFWTSSRGRVAEKTLSRDYKRLICLLGAPSDEKVGNTLLAVCCAMTKASQALSGAPLPRGSSLYPTQSQPARHADLASCPWPLLRLARNQRTEAIPDILLIAPSLGSSGKGFVSARLVEEMQHDS
jgi:hypothetical protein